MDEDLALALQLQDELNSDANESVLILPDTNTDKSKPISIVDPQWELTDPIPDIRALLVQFDGQFFWGRLYAVTVTWSPRMYSCAGVCCYEGRGGLCCIRLSQPLLKLRPRKDLIETLLHEMIHAYLFVTDNNKDHDGHGAEFHKHMYRINKDTGTKISVYHNFHDEVNEYKKHWWRCDGACRNRKPFYGYVKRTCNRAPSFRDLWWERHKKDCGGVFVKVKEPEGFGQKKKPTTDGKTDKKAPKKTPSKPNADIRSFGGVGRVLGSSNPNQTKVKPSTSVTSHTVTSKAVTNGATTNGDTSSYPGNKSTNISVKTPSGTDAVKENHKDISKVKVVSGNKGLKNNGSTKIIPTSSTGTSSNNKNISGFASTATQGRTSTITVPNWSKKPKLTETVTEEKQVSTENKFPGAGIKLGGSDMCDKRRTDNSSWFNDNATNRDVCLTNVISPTKSGKKRPLDGVDDGSSQSSRTPKQPKINAYFKTTPPADKVCKPLQNSDASIETGCDGNKATTIEADCDGNKAATIDTACEKKVTQKSNTNEKTTDRTTQDNTHTPSASESTISHRESIDLFDSSIISDDSSVYRNNRVDSIDLLNSSQSNDSDVIIIPDSPLVRVNVMNNNTGSDGRGLQKCPVCSRDVAEDMNVHLDLCLFFHSQDS